jgi:hypothetical protein
VPGKNWLAFSLNLDFRGRAIDLNRLRYGPRRGRSAMGGLAGLEVARLGSPAAD